MSDEPLPDQALYQPTYCPWYAGGDAEFRAVYEPIRPVSLVGSDRSYVLYTLLRQTLMLGQGDVVEAGVYKGGTAMMLAAIIERYASDGVAPTLHLFDTFAGMPETDAALDVHVAGDFADTSADAVRERVPQSFVELYVGRVPETFADLDAMRVRLAHVDVDIYRSVVDCCAFLYPRLVAGGAMVFDDYGFDSCPGARRAVDEFFRDKAEHVWVLPTGQAVVLKLPDASR